MSSQDSISQSQETVVQITLTGQTTGEEDVINLHNCGFGYREISKRTGWSESKVQCYLLRNGYFNESRCDIDEITELGQRIKELYEGTTQTFSEVVQKVETNPNKARGAYKYVTDRVGEKSIQKDGSLHKLTQQKIQSPDVSFKTYDGYERVTGVSWNQVTSRPKHNRKEQVLIHRLVAVAKFGFDAVADMDVHHKNGIGWDNRPSNIEPIDPKSHINKHWHKDGLLLQIAEAEDQELRNALSNAGYPDAAAAIEGGVSP